MAQKLGLDPEVFHDIASKASGQSWSMSTYTPVPGVGPDTPADHDYEGGFAAALMLKDLKLAMDAAQTRGRLHADRLRGGGTVPALRQSRRRIEGFLRHHQDARRQLESLPNRNRSCMRIVRVDCPCIRVAARVRAEGRTQLRRTTAERRRQRRAERLPRHPPLRRRPSPPTKEEALKIMHERHEGMEKIGKSTKTIKRTLESSVARSSRRSAQRRRRSPTWPASRPTWFPQGTGPDVGKTGAKPEIWQNSRRLRREGSRLPARPPRHSTPLPTAGTRLRSSRGFADLGKTCKACHDKYRAEMHH